MGARLSVFEVPSQGSAATPVSSPASDKWDSAPSCGRWLADRLVGTADAKVTYLIDGWLAETGTSVWFGAGSTGKTQLMLWMAAMLASRPEDRPEQVWLGGRIHGTGHVLVLTAEDTRDQILGRLRDVVEHAMGQDHAARQRTCSRIHVMPFLSMTEQEFRHANPSLFEQSLRERHWEASGVMREVRRYIDDWNLAHSQPDERIIGVVMDSATSMSGFDSLDAQATTNFFFYLGRLCERLRIFWAIIGHTPKTTTIARKTYRATAPSRLRGVAMWTTAPRLTVEVRLSQAWREGRKTSQEGQDYLDWLPSGWRPDNLLVVYVAKANLKHASKSERYLARQRHGAFVDITDKPEEALTNGLLTGWDAGSIAVEESSLPAVATAAGSAVRARKPTPRRSGRPALDPASCAAGTRLVHEVILAMSRTDLSNGRISANGLRKTIATSHAQDPRASFVKSAYGGDKVAARVGAINWHLSQLEEQGVLLRRGRYFHVRERHA